MARPKKEGMDYFPHDTDAVNDEKIEALRALYGNDGYAFYFILLERIYRTKNFEIEVSDAETIQILARKISITPDKFNQILKTALKWKCFDPIAYEERGVLTSEGIKKRSSVVIEKRKRMRKRYYENKDDISEAETGEETIAESAQSKVKKSKVKKSNIININLGDEFTNLIGGTLDGYKLEELKSYIIDDGMDEDVILEAMKRTSEVSSPSYKYLKGILNKWVKNNIKTMEDVNKEDIRFERFKKNKDSPERNRIKIPTADETYKKFAQDFERWSDENVS